MQSISYSLREWIMLLRMGKDGEKFDKMPFRQKDPVPMTEGRGCPLGEEGWTVQGKKLAQRAISPQPSPSQWASNVCVCSYIQMSVYMLKVLI